MKLAAAKNAKSEAVKTYERDETKNEKQKKQNENSESKKTEPKKRTQVNSRVLLKLGCRFLK